MDLFKEVIPSILQTKQYHMQTEEDESKYSSFLVNRALSYHLDCIMHAQEMNASPADNKLKYDYLINSIRPMRRKFQSWTKKSKDESIDDVKLYYGFSTQKAQEALRILSDEQLTTIKNKTRVGGVKNDGKNT